MNDYPLTAGRYLIEASAGTGKTYTITHLVLSLIEQGTPVREILVTTFSKAAAAELKARILKLLNETLNDVRKEENEAKAAGKTPDDDGAEERSSRKLLLMRAVSSIDEMTVSTIHSFCQRMLGEFVLETGQGFDLELVANNSKYIDSLLRAFCRKEFYGGARGLNFANCRKAAGLAEQMVDDCPPPDVENPDSERMVLYRAYCYVRDRLQRAKDEDGAFTFDDMIRVFCDALEADPGLAEQIRQRYRAVFVDEFQDTDRVQYRIFDRCFPRTLPSGKPNDRTVFYMIGDPKQAIYAFRGADIYTYLQAKGSASQSFHLTENFRSSPAMISAVNSMFGDGRGSDAVFLQNGIPFVPVTSGKTPEDFPRDTGPCLRLSRYTGTKGNCVDAIMADVVRDVRELLARAESMTVIEEKEINGEKRRIPRPLRASDIAILVQKHDEASDFVKRLNRAGIAASACKSGKIYGTGEAKVMLLLLKAFLEPGLQSVRGLMLSPFFRYSCDDVLNDPVLVESVMKLLSDCGAVWRQSGLPAAFLGFLDAPCGDRGTPRLRVLSESTGERSLTNYLHLMELLYQGEQEEHLQPEDVLNRLNLAISGHAAEEPAADAGVEDNPDQLRLDRDSASVQIMTMFTAKGLEFPVVFVPFPSKSDAIELSRKKPIAYRVNSAMTGDPESRITLDFGQNKSNEAILQKELLRSAVRLLYVALTRATLVTYLYVQQLAERPKQGRPLNFVRSAQGVLLRNKRLGTADEFLEYLLTTNDYRIDETSPDADGQYLAADWYRELLAKRDSAAADASSGRSTGFELLRDRTFDGEPRNAVSGSTGPADDGAAFASELREAPVMEAPDPPAIPDEWRMMSFTAFHAKLTNTAYKDSETSADYDASVEQDAAQDVFAGDDASSDASGTANSFRSFPHGEKAGTLTHGILEDFATTVPDRADDGVTCYFNLFSDDREARYRDQVMAWLKNRLRDQLFREDDARAMYDGVRCALRTPLPGLGMSLCSLRRNRMTAEMEFFLNAPASLNLSRILSILRRFASEAARTHLADYQDVNFDKKGILNGVVDLIFEHGGRFYIVDWKTNWLGNGDAAYSPDRIAEAMGNAGYILQSYLYAAGLLAMLRQRGLGDDAFGGVYYLFLRGVDGVGANGVWHDVPPLPCLEALLDLFQGDGRS